MTVEEEDAIAKAEKLLYLPLMTNRGSCGALNSNMVRYLQEIESPYAVCCCFAGCTVVMSFACRGRTHLLLIF